MKKPSLQILIVIFFSITSLALSVSYGIRSETVSLMVANLYLAIGILGILVSKVLVDQEKAIKKLQESLKQNTL
jgi:hypothetical protein